MNNNQTDNAGLYIHIPFCVRKCIYCDFYSTTDGSLIDQYIIALLREIRSRTDGELEFDTIYFGGGTPSVLKTDYVSKILNTIQSHFKISANPEITIECNPNTIQCDQLRRLKNLGINRINIGIQSFSDYNLELLGRIHSADESVKSIENAKMAGLDNIGVDLIYGLPGQDENNLLSDLNHILEINPAHISCYMLTYEPDTILTQKRDEGKIIPLGDELVGRLFSLTMEKLTDSGYDFYEVSNFAVSPKRRSRHNQKYWSGVPYLGFGPSAHSYIDGKRSWNINDVDQYIINLSAGETVLSETETLSKDQLLTEAIYLGLRRVEGIDLTSLNNKFNIDFIRIYNKTITELTNENMINISGNRCALTRKGFLYLDSITARLIELD